MKKTTLLIVLSMICAFVGAQTVEQTYVFNQPAFRQLQGYEQLQLNGCMQSAVAGQPCLPWQSVSLMLPEGQEASDIEVILSDFKELEGTHELFPYQPSRTTDDRTPRALVKDETLYASKSVYPVENHGMLTTQYKNGFGFAFCAFTPVQYIPATGTVRYATKATVRIHLTAAKADHSSMRWNTPTVRNNVCRLAQNPEMIDSYQTRDRDLGAYDVLIITGAGYANGYEEYVNYYNSIGLRCRIATTADIYAAMTGVDNADKVRNYIIQEYQENGILMVVLGGDVEIVPHRSLYCYVTSGGGDQESNSIPADLYYSALDGNWNDNGNNRWGEPGEDDLLPEIGISRMSFRNNNDLQNMIHKTLSYQQQPILGEFRNIILAGEHLYDNPTSNGSDYLELLVGTHNDNGYTTTCYPEDYNFTRLYEEQGTWSGEALRQAINGGVGYVHHDGHANSGYVAGWWGISNSDFNGANGTTHNYTFFHSQGCDCGAFDQSCILEKMVTIENFAVAVIGNSRYGWFNEGQTEGPGAHLEREMTDAQFHDRIDLLGCAISEGKTMTAPWVTAPGQWEEGALRWNFYDMNVLGDGAVSVWLDEPFTPEIACQEQILVGTTGTTVTVTDANGNGQFNFRCSFFHDDELIGFATTDENGEAEIEFVTPIDFVDEVHLIVTGANAWPQTLELATIPNNAAYVVFDAYELAGDANGQADFGETLSLNVRFKNVGSMTADNVTATLTTESEYVTVQNGTATLGSIGAEQTLTLNGVFSVTIGDNVPDLTNAKLFLTCTDGTDTWNSKFNLKMHAPAFAFTDMVIDDAQGNHNGSVDPGETVTVHFSGVNNGSSAAPQTVFEVFNGIDDISAAETHFTLGTVGAGEPFTADFTFTLSQDAPLGVAYQLPVAVYSGNYLAEDFLTFAVGQVMEGFETGDFSAFDWHHGSVVTAWEIVTHQAYEGSYCARSSQIGDTETSVLYIDLQTAANDQVSFYYKVSSEANYDKLHFSIDGEEKGNWSGTIDWTLASFPITPGSHRLQWQYSKDSSLSSGQDCAWIDNVVFPPTTTITKVEATTAQPALYPNPNHGQFQIDLPEEACVLTVFNSLGQRVYQAENVQGLTHLNLQQLDNGLYFLNVQSATVHHTQKFIKQ